MKRSLRRQLLFTVIAVVSVALLMVGLFHYFFLERYYQQQKIKTLASAYNTVNSSLINDSYEKSTERMEYISSQKNIEFLITDSNFVPVYSTYEFNDEMISRLFGYYTGLYRDDVQELAKNDKFHIQKTQTRSNIKFLELWGNLDDGSIVLLRTPMDAIKESAAISNRFYIFVGLLAILLISLLTWFLTKRLTAPIKELTEISGRMSKLDFEARYTPNEKNANEIDELGIRFNEMSDKLKRTIGKLKKANLELKKDVEKKEEIDKMRIEFLNNVSHELKTPITLISGYAEGIRDGVASDEETKKEYLDVIIDESEKMDILVRQLLSLTKIESGNIKLNIEAFDIKEIICDILGRLEYMQDKYGIKVVFDKSNSVLCWGDPFKIEEVITNYLTNAYHYADREKIVEITVTRDNGKILVNIFNTGSPISQNDLPHIFEKFYKVDKARTREYGGTGIGLSIVKAIVDAHGQECGVKNYDNGCAFYFTLDEVSDGT